MKLIGMLDSPFVRRVAISLQRLGLPFEHEPLSVFRTFDAFRRINPAVKAPTLVCDDGEVLMDSSLILEHAEALARPRSLWPRDPQERRHALSLTGLALAACEKGGQIIYERGLRPPEKIHAPWIERVSTQLLGACGALENELARRPIDVASGSLGHAGIAIAVAWTFTQHVVPAIVPARDFARLAAFTQAAEALPEFRAAPYGEAPMAAQAAAAPVASAADPVQRQLDAYNARDLERFLAEYSDDVRVFRPPDPQPVLSGKQAFGEHYARHRFNLPDLHARLLDRMVAGRIVVDREEVTGVPDGPLAAVAVYEVADGRIRTVWFY